jgi:phosphate transport system permease protein
VVYGYFAALTVAPAVRDFAQGIGISSASTESAVAAGLVMGVMIIPFVSSMADDPIAAVPDAARRQPGDGRHPRRNHPQGAGSRRPARHRCRDHARRSRAIGETMIVVMAAGASANLTANPFQSMTTVTFQIVAMLTGEGSFDHPATLSAFALGMVLFLSPWRSTSSPCAW